MKIIATLVLFIVDKEGKIIYAGAGYNETIEKKIERSIDSAL